MKQNNYQYYSASSTNFVNQLELSSLTELCNFAQQNNVNAVFILNKEDVANTSFAINFSGCIIQHKTNGFQTLEHYATATEKGFTNAQEFYEALDLGHTKYDDYILVKQSGIKDLATFETIKKKGFIKGFADYKELKNSIEIDVAVDNPYQLYVYAKEHHFEDANSLLEALKNGFKDAAIYASAKDLGFNLYADYVEAIEKSLRTFAELELARKIGIRNAVDFHKYTDLQVLRKNDEKHDELLVLIILSRVEEGKKVSLNKLNTILQNTIQEYKYPETNEMPSWFTISISSLDDLARFLQKNNQVKKYGTYDIDGEFFEINRLQDRAVVIDASNVAHNSNSNTDKKILAKNISIVVDFLQQKGFTDITIIADASLRHKISDGEVLQTIKNNYTYLEAPKESPADIFIIQYVKTHHCLIISNDTFREWKLQDLWVADNIDFYRLSFLIKGNEVLMPDLK